MLRGYNYAQEHNVAPLKKFVGKAAPTRPTRPPTQITVVQLLLVGILSALIGALVTITILSPEMLRRIQNKEAW